MDSLWWLSAVDAQLQEAGVTLTEDELIEICTGWSWLKGLLDDAPSYLAKVIGATRPRLSP